MLSAKETNRIYFREAYRTGVHGWKTGDPDPCALRFLEQASAMAPGGALLDAGCGEGRHSFAARRLGFKVTGIDLEPMALVRARRLARRDHLREIRFIVADVLCLPFPGSRFDVVLDYGCLHHQKKSDWPSYMAEVLRILKPRGFYILSVFSPRFRFFRPAGRPWHIANGAYRRCFTLGEILAMFEREFEIRELVEEHAEGQGFWHAIMSRRARTATKRNSRRFVRIPAEQKEQPPPASLTPGEERPRPDA